MLRVPACVSVVGDLERLFVCKIERIERGSSVGRAWVEPGLLHLEERPWFEILWGDWLWRVR
jgi:hypothetical protein